MRTLLLEALVASLFLSTVSATARAGQPEEVDGMTGTVETGQDLELGGDTTRFRIAMLDVRATGPVVGEQVEGVSAFIASSLQRHGGIEVVTGADIRELLGFEAQRQLMGCEDDASCLVEIAGALNVRYLMATEISRFGTQWLLSFTLLDVEEAGAIGRATLKAASEDELISRVEGAIVELLSRLPGWAPRGNGSPGLERLPGRAFSLTVTANTDVPLQIGLGLVAEVSGRARLSSSLGVMPGPYVDLINGVAVSLDGYDETTATLIRAALGSSLVWRLHMGWRPVSRLGLYVEAGYGLVALGGSATSAEIVAVATGRELPDGVTRTEHDFNIRSSLHMASVAAGWGWRLPHGIVLCVGLGGAFTFFANTAVTPDFTPRPLAESAVNSLAAAAEDYLDETYRRYSHAPVVSVSAGYTF